MIREDDGLAHWQLGILSCASEWVYAARCDRDGAATDRWVCWIAGILGPAADPAGGEGGRARERLGGFGLLAGHWNDSIAQTRVPE